MSIAATARSLGNSEKHITKWTSFWDLSARYLLWNSYYDTRQTIFVCCRLFYHYWVDIFLILILYCCFSSLHFIRKYVARCCFWKCFSSSSSSGWFGFSSIISRCTLFVYHVWVSSAQYFGFIAVRSGGSISSTIKPEHTKQEPSEKENMTNKSHKFLSL